MNGEAGSRVRSTIVKVPDASPGLLFLNGQQKPFTLEGIWKSPVAPAANMTVDVDLDTAGSISSITVVDSQQLAKEKMNQIGGIAQERGKEAAKLAQKGVGALAARMGAVALACAVLVWIAWFLLPTATISAGFGGGLSFTFWNFLGLDPSNPQTMMGPDAGGSHGVLGLLGLLAIVAPFVAPFIKAPWAKYLNAAPLAFILLGFTVTYMQINKALSPMEGMGMPSPLSWGWGLYVLVLAALVLAAQALKKPAAA
jgi:hypothetical protein